VAALRLAAGLAALLARGRGAGLHGLAGLRFLAAVGLAGPPGVAALRLAAGLAAALLARGRGTGLHGLAAGRSRTARPIEQSRLGSGGAGRNQHGNCGNRQEKDTTVHWGNSLLGKTEWDTKARWRGWGLCLRSNGDYRRLAGRFLRPDIPFPPHLAYPPPGYERESGFDACARFAGRRDNSAAPASCLTAATRRATAEPHPPSPQPSLESSHQPSAIGYQPSREARK